MATIRVSTFKLVQAKQKKLHTVEHVGSGRRYILVVSRNFVQLYHRGWADDRFDRPLPAKMAWAAFEAAGRPAP